MWVGHMLGHIIDHMIIGLATTMLHIYYLTKFYY